MAKRITLNELPDERPVDEILADIRQLYFKTSAGTIERDFDRAIDLLKSIRLPEDRQRATVYMEGLAEMRNEWKGKRRTRNAKTARSGGMAGTPGAPRQRKDVDKDNP